MFRKFPAVLALGLILCAGPAGAGRASAAAVRRSVLPGESLDNAVISDTLRPLPKKHGVPALAGAVLTSRGLEAVGAVGVRKLGTDVPVTTSDLWHLGSDTKAMTAAMIGALVERGTLTWETTIPEVFPDVAPALPEGLKKVTILHLLSHRSGLPANIPWGLLPKKPGTREARLDVIGRLPKIVPAAEPGAKYLYSNLGYVVAGAMAEKAANASWEDLMKNLIFKPLGMASVGFGGVGSPGKLDQPWGHGADGLPVRTNGPETDNPPVMGPAGTVHCTLEDWAKFVGDQLRGARGEKALLKPETYKTLQTPPFGGDYALGWLVVDREWGGGAVLTHNGSNNMNFAVVWMAPKKDFAVLVVSNQGGPAAAKACDDAAGALIKLKTTPK
jgi:CubicO group peptidase (beta-lactamase class C family)